MSAICDIEFKNNPKKIVYTEQLFGGTVRLYLPEKINARGVYLHIKGKGYARWHQGRTAMVAKEKYFDGKMYLAGTSDGRDDFALKAGMHVYPFGLELPSDLPSSFEARHGHIRYTIEVVIDVPLWMNKVFKEEFTVIKSLNLDDHPSLREPLIVEEFSNVSPFGLCYFGSGKIRICARMPVSGFIPREMMHLEIHVDNQSSVTISEFSIELLRVITYEGSAGCCILGYGGKKDRKTLFRKISDGCKATEDKTIHITAQIPVTVPTASSESNIIKLTYVISIIAWTQCPFKRAIVNLPVVIASDPFQDTSFF